MSVSLPYTAQEFAANVPHSFEVEDVTYYTTPSEDYPENVDIHDEEHDVSFSAEKDSDGTLPPFWVVIEELQTWLPGKPQLDQVTLSALMQGKQLYYEKLIVQTKKQLEFQQKLLYDTMKSLATLKAGPSESNHATELEKILIPSMEL